MKKTSVNNAGVEISVIIANRNNGIFLPRLLASLISESGNFEVIVVDDHSSDQSNAIVQKFKKRDRRIKLIKLTKHEGAAKTRNIGAAESRGRYLFFLDSDTKVKQGWTREIEKFFLRHPDTGIAIAKLLKMGTNRFDSAGEMTSPFCFLVERARGAVDTGQFDREDRIFSGKSAGMIVRREIFEKLGGFDESYVIFLEDTDLSWRAQLLGFEVRFIPQVVVWHSFWTEEKPFLHYLANRVYYHGAKNTVITVIKNLSFYRLLYILPVHYLVWIALGMLSIVRGRFYQGSEILKGIFITIIRFAMIFRKRNSVQKMRSVADADLFDQLIINPTLTYYLKKTRAYSGGTEY